MAFGEVGCSARPRNFPVLGCLLAVAFSSHAYGDIVLALDPFGGTVFDTGQAGPNKLINFYISQDGSNFLAGTTPQFELEAGVVTAGIVSVPGGTGTPGYFGAGEWFASDFKIIDADYFEVVQEADDLSTGVTPASFPSFERYFTLELDTTGLAAGDYLIELLPGPMNFTTFGMNGLEGIESNTEFTFQVAEATAVPEPSTFLFMTLGGLAVFYRRVASRSPNQATAKQ